MEAKKLFFSDRIRIRNLSECKCPYFIQKNKQTKNQTKQTKKTQQSQKEDLNNFARYNPSYSPLS